MAIPNEMREAYRAYITSPEWRQKRKTALDSAHGKCQRCGVRSRQLAVHHKTYQRFGHEEPDDLIAVCPECHDLEDKLRAEAGRRRSEAAYQEAQEARYTNGLNTFMSKKYGPDWQDRGRDPAEFDDWLERKAAREMVER